MNYWDHVLKFHENSHMNHENGKMGLTAVKYLRSGFEAYTHHFTASHPFVTRLCVSYVQNYDWLIQFARKIPLLRSIEGSEALLLRFSKSNEFNQALAEIEVALKLKLAGFDVLFGNPTPQYRTPDILVKHDSFAFNLEVTTLNSPEENTRLNDLQYKILDILLENRGPINLGGMIGSPPTIGESDKFLQLLRSKVQESRENKQVGIANEPGLPTIDVVPQQLQDRMPEDTWTQFRFNPKRPRPAIDRIIDKLHRKAAQVCHQDRPGILVLYSGTSSWGPNAIFMDSGSRIDVVQSTYRNVMGIVLSSHQLWKNYGAASVTKPLENRM